MPTHTAARARRLGVAELLRQAQARVAGLGAQPEVRVEILRLLGSSLLNLEDLDAAERAAQQALAEALHLSAPTTSRPCARAFSCSACIAFAAARRRCGASSKLWRLACGAGARSMPPIESRCSRAARTSRSTTATRRSRCPRPAKRSSWRSHRSASVTARTVTAATLLAEAYEYSDVTAEFALAAAERAFGLAVALYGGDSPHPRMINVRDVYGRALARAGRLEEGVAQLERAMRDATEVFGATSPRSRTSLPTSRAISANSARSSPRSRTRSRNRDQHGTRRAELLYITEPAHRARYRTALRPARRGGAARSDGIVRGSSQAAGPRERGDGDRRFQPRAGARVSRQSGSSARRVRACAPVLPLDLQRPLYLPSRPLRGRGYGAAPRGDFPAALAQQEEALATIAPDANAERLRMPVLLETGLNHLGLGEPEQALALLEEARRLEAGFTPAVTPLRADILVGVGRARLALGDAGAALDVLQQADDLAGIRRP